MKREIYQDSRPAGLVIENLETGVIYDIFTCPDAITTEAQNACHRGQRSGLIYGAGQRWQFWDDTPQADDVMIELTRDGIVEDVVAIPATGWRAWELISASRGVDPREWLQTVLGAAMSEGVSVRECLGWLFPRKNDAVPLYEEAERDLYNEGRLLI